LTEQQQNFLSALAVQAKGDINKALNMAGYKETSYYNVINNLKDEIVEVATKILAKSAPQASQKLVEILESDDPIPQVNAKLQAAQTLLDRVVLQSVIRLMLPIPLRVVSFCYLKRKL